MNRHYLNRTGFYKLAQSIKDYINREITGYDKLGTASTKDFTTYVSPTQTEQLPISSSVYSAMTNMLRGAYHPAGSKTIAELTSDLLVKANLGNVYKITEDGVTSDLFIGGAGQTIKTGDNAIVLFASEDTYRFSLESGVVDLDAYQKKELTTPLTIGGTQQTTVEGALGGLNELVPSDASSNNKLAIAKQKLDVNTTKQSVVTSSAVSYRSFSLTDTNNISHGYQPHCLLLISREEIILVNVRIHLADMNVEATRISGSQTNITKLEYEADNTTHKITFYASLAAWAMTFSVQKITIQDIQPTNPIQITSIPSGIKEVSIFKPTSTATSASTAPITSGGVYAALHRPFEADFNVDNLYVGQGVSKLVNSSLTQNIYMGTAGNAITIRVLRTTSYSEERAYYSSSSGIVRTSISGEPIYTATIAGSLLKLTIPISSSDGVKLSIERIA